MNAKDSDEQNPACKIMTFRPTMEEFKDFNKYLVYMESKGAHRSGLAKVIPPKGWKPKRHYDDIDDLVIPAPIQQMVTGQSGLFTQYNIQKKPMTVKEFRRLANSDKYCTPRYMDYEDLERKYWKNLTFVAPIYGADVNGSLYDEDIDEWNISRLNTILDVVGEECGISIEGVNTPYLYFGMWKTTFAWHTEDMDLYSINYLHFGEPKSWYSIPPEHGKRLERLAQGFFPSSCQGCDAFLRHKMTLISPSILKKYGIPFDKVTQEAGEFMITFPYGYHAGFNHGFNCAESTNFATVRWIDYGKIAKLCSCSSDMVKISMDIFVKMFQPEKYEIWKQGKDIYTIDHTKPTIETTPEVKAWMSKRRRRMKNALKGLQHTTSRSKKLKTQEDKKVSTMVVGAEIIATEAATDGFKVNEKLTENAVLVNKEVPSGDEKNIRGVHLDHSLLNNIQAPGCFPIPLAKDTKPEEIDNHDLSLAASGLAELCGSFAQSSPVKVEDSMEENDQKAYIQKTQTYHLLEVETLEKEETCSFSSGADADDVSDLEVADCGLEPGEVPSLMDEGIQSSEQTNLCGWSENNGKRQQRAKSWRLPLGKPPSRSLMTVVKQQANSDEEFQEFPVEQTEETETWAKPLLHIWQSKVQSFAAEREYNESVSKLKPYCAICSLFLPYYKSETYNDDVQSYWETVSSEIPPLDLKTKPLIPEMCFLYSEENTEYSPTNSFIDGDGKSQLIVCTKCRVQVHASCYGVPSHEIHDGWMCSRCRIGIWTAECCLCSLRGGALKQTTENKWAHIMCAIAVPEVRFENVMERSQIDTSRIPLERLKLRTKTTKQNINVGQMVIAKHRNTRYYSCKVTEITSQTFYEVEFDDGSISKDTFPEDIVSRDCLKLGPPIQGQDVQVKWPDGLLYGAKYLGCNVIYMYKVEFEDGSQIVTKREDIYTMDEELPKKIKSRYSKASDMKFEDAFYGADVIKGDRKRQRVLNVKFKNEYVDDPGYRTFLKSSFQRKNHKRQQN
ncbi:lysine-specific demethylase 4C isoform X2 [Engystomops pustulosus]|uniref:lysine-specific demethylase 4C isoform X2 n=1 Tax=Engystomops pustulosus TaxID=76066 RepID=UPI003AFAEFDD